MHTIKIISDAEIDAALKFQNPSNAQLLCLASRCGYSASINKDYEPVIKIDGIAAPVLWDPVNDKAQNHKLLEVLINEADCRLFYDHEVSEYFIYMFQYEDGYPNPPLSHRTSLAEAVVEAAVTRWCPED